MAEAELCGICRCAYGAADATRLSCAHSFHSACVAAWFYSRHNTCPLCRAVFFEAPDGQRRGALGGAVDALTGGGGGGQARRGGVMVVALCLIFLVRALFTHGGALSGAQVWAEWGPRHFPPPLADALRAPSLYGVAAQAGGLVVDLVLIRFLSVLYSLYAVLSLALQLLALVVQLF